MYLLSHRENENQEVGMVRQRACPPSLREESQRTILQAWGVSVSHPLLLIFGRDAAPAILKQDQLLRC
jgi:hypothetical protein